MIEIVALPPEWNLYRMSEASVNIIAIDYIGQFVLCVIKSMNTYLKQKGLCKYYSIHLFAFLLSV